MDVKPGFVLPPRITLQEALQQTSNGGVAKRRGITEADRPSKKGHPWTEEEHAAFLEGLQRFGKGSWLAISRHCVKTRNPTQIASHAQKYFLRLSQGVARSSRFTAVEQEHNGAIGQDRVPLGAKPLGYAARLTRVKSPGPETEDGAVFPLPAPASAQGPPPSQTSNGSSVRRPQPVRVLAKHDFDVLAPSPNEPLPAGGTLQTSAGSAFSALHPSPSLPQPWLGALTR